MIDNNNINQIIDACLAEGYSIRVRDISYIILCEQYKDKDVAYRSLMFADSDVNKYDKSKPITFLKKYMAKHYLKKGKADISFEENKAYMLKLKKDTEAAMAAGEIDKKDGLKILSDISVKLNDKFGAKEDVREQMIIVNKKYNSICQCGREIYVPTKEDLMEQYGLIEKTKKDEL